MNSEKIVTVVAMASLGINNFLHARHPLIELFLVIYGDDPPNHSSFFNAVSEVGHLSLKHNIIYYGSIVDREGQEVPGIVNDKKLTKNGYSYVIKYSKDIAYNFFAK